MNPFNCQFKCIPDLEQETSARVMVIQGLRKTLLRAKWLVRYLQSRSGSNKGLTTPRLSLIKSARNEMGPGDMVRVRSEQQIRGMLDYRGVYKGCPFLREQYSHCGRSYKVFKEVYHFYDEIKNKLCKCNNMVLLEDVFCSGKQRLYSEPCDMNCYFFWHKDWLEKI